MLLYIHVPFLHQSLHNYLLDSCIRQGELKARFHAVSFSKRQKMVKTFELSNGKTAKYCVHVHVSSTHELSLSSTGLDT